MRCSRCGMEYDSNAAFCPRCGTITQKRYDNIDYKNNGYNNYQSPKKNDNTVMIVAIVILGIVLMSVAIFVGYTVADSGNKKELVEVTASPVPTATPTPEPTFAIVTAPPVTPVPTKVPTPVPYIYNGYSGSYKTYSNSTYGFSCIYPSSFRVYDDGKKTLYTVMSPDGQGRVLIDAVYCSNYPINDRTAYINSIGGTVTYKAGDGDFFATSVRKGNMIYYKYAKYRNGIRYSFEVIYPQSQYDDYDIIINDIYDDFYIY